MTENRPWGTYEILLENENYKVKLITVKPNEQLSIQYHHKRNEVWTIVSGEGYVTVDNGTTLVTYGDVVKIKKLQHHTIRNVSDQDLVFIEVQTGTYFGEDDIIRISDKYGRV